MFFKSIPVQSPERWAFLSSRNQPAPAQAEQSVGQGKPYKKM